MGAHGRAGRHTVVMMAVIALQLVACLVVLLVPLDDRPHHAPVTIGGPLIVANSLAGDVNARPGRPLDAEAVGSAQAARADVQQGRAVAAVAFDLRLNSATVFVSSAQGPALTSAVSGVIRELAAPFAVAVTTEDVAPLPDGSAGQTGLRLVVALAVLVGLGVAVVATWRRGPVTDTSSQALRRMLFAVVVGGVVSLGLAAFAAGQIGGSLLEWWAVLTLTTLATSAAILGLAGLLGLAGIGLATVVLLVSAVPLARVEHPLLLPTPWAQVTPWLPHGACLDASRQIAFFHGAGVARPLVVLVGWIAVSCIALAVARRERRRAGVRWRAAGESTLTAR